MRSFFQQEDVRGDGRSRVMVGAFHVLTSKSKDEQARARTLWECKRGRGRCWRASTGVVAMEEFGCWVRAGASSRISPSPNGKGAKRNASRPFCKTQQLISATWLQRPPKGLLLRRFRPARARRKRRRTSRRCLLASPQRSCWLQASGRRRCCRSQRTSSSSRR